MIKNIKGSDTSKPSSGYDLLERHILALNSYFASLDLAILDEIGQLIYDRCLRGNSVFCVGNGGSAATASHLATDLFFGRRLGGELRPKAISLVSNVPLITALSNDIGYDEVFVEQLNGQFNTGDIVIAISASGNSKNVLRAVEFAKSHGGSSIGLVGFDGGELKNLVDLCMHVDTRPGEYELVEDVHHALCHMVANYLKFKLTSDNL